MTEKDRSKRTKKQPSPTVGYNFSLTREVGLERNFYEESKDHLIPLSKVLHTMTCVGES